MERKNYNQLNKKNNLRQIWNGEALAMELKELPYLMNPRRKNKLSRMRKKKTNRRNKSTRKR